jgi:hypothetical protein
MPRVNAFLVSFVTEDGTAKKVTQAPLRAGLCSFCHVGWQKHKLLKQKNQPIKITNTQFNWKSILEIVAGWYIQLPYAIKG